jgi:hypothetical protein
LLTRFVGKRTSKSGWWGTVKRLGRRYGPSALAAGGSLLGRISGLGSYRTAGGVIGAGSQVPSFGTLRPTTEGGVVVTHREYIQDIVSGSGTPTTFDMTLIPVQPGHNGSFPWLASIAVCFEQYKMRGMVYQFRTTSGNSVAAANTSLGAVIMATEYNVGAPSFGSKSEMENYAQGQSGVPSEDIIHAVECQKSQTPVTALYVRGLTLPPGEDPRLYDLGNFCIATQGCPAAGATLGELWCTYCIELIKPRLPPNVPTPGPVPGGILTDHFVLGVTGLTASGNRYFGNPGSDTFGVLSQLGGTIYSSLSFDIYRMPGYAQPPGSQMPIGTQLLIQYYVKGTSATLTTATTLSLGGSWSNSSNKLAANTYKSNVDAGAGTSIQYLTQLITKTSMFSHGYDEYFYVNTGTLPSSITYADLWVTVFPT